MAQVTPYKTKYIQKRQSLKNYSLSLIFFNSPNTNKGPSINYRNPLIFLGKYFPRSSYFLKYSWKLDTLAVLLSVRTR